MVYTGLGCIEAGRMPHIDYVYCEVISKSNTLRKFDRNLKRLRWSYKKLCDIKSILLALKQCRGGI